MKHRATASFWTKYQSLPKAVRRLADKSFVLMKSNPRHPSLHFKKVSEFWSARIDINYRALALESADGFDWFWIGTHAEYDRLLK
ncbi:hypothetical protein NKH52_11285 [Mesorhizobium sp. M1066]|uniref:hypothetical protein n=1 Tax=unclassified Mesorhizobium TaxID=325217 RepID=UPI000FCB2EF6|nr:hypothetical protein [Mesorhizobium sp. M7A.F.Ca.US.011.01.1.1]RUX27758.1 hypothetical protein EOA13_19430 [Mesorhizobium sp. M7A.F.Ca.US.011.01.1.1]